MAAIHSCTCSWPWLLNCPSHQWWTIQACMWPHLWMSSRWHQTWIVHHHRCSPSYSPAPATRAVHNQSPPPVAPTTPQPAAATRTSTATHRRHLPLCIHLKVHSSWQLYDNRPVQPQLPFTDLPEPVSHQASLLMRCDDDLDSPGWRQPWWYHRMCMYSHAQWILTEMNWHYLPNYLFHSLKYSLR